MKLNKEQRKSLAKTIFDCSKIIFAIAVVTPLVSQKFNLMVIVCWNIIICDIFIHWNNFRKRGLKTMNDPMVLTFLVVLVFALLFGGFILYSDWREKHPKTKTT